MSAGRCSGCGLEDRSCKKIGTHIHTCSSFLELFRSDPDKALEPEEEYRRYHAWLKTEEGQEFLDDQRADRIDAYREEGEERLERHRERWGGRDQKAPLDVT